MFTCDPGFIHLYTHGTHNVAIKCQTLTVDDPLLTVDTRSPEAEAAAQVAGATLYLMGIDTAALKALPWPVDGLVIEHEGARPRFELAKGFDFLDARSLRVRTRGERHYATREEPADPYWAKGVKGIKGEKATLSAWCDSPVM
ncbi:hypothetical protein OR16_36212 [Cupriavidus basilensis OR16]|uniref:Uncharacterized protein n=1 Tax=Cupriavidus basilensis OR16 TaxID=1127483 RepID=H1SFV6_9BURK|nr:hypothetical protein [Cupriavidus basilensis]EHP38678.1 hypothetical protein OR16_36212 [Cupriavidus basilensis OR16]